MPLSTSVRVESESSLNVPSASRLRPLTFGPVNRDLRDVVQVKFVGLCREVWVPVLKVRRFPLISAYPSLTEREHGDTGVPRSMGSLSRSVS